MSETPKLALAMIVKPSDDEAVLLRRCLSYVSYYVDKIFITITGENEAVEEVAESYGAEVSHFAWVNDFAAARNFNFSQVPKKYGYQLWLDTDDVVRGAEKLPELVKYMSENAVDAVVMRYLYDFDAEKLPTVVHLKTRIIKNDGCLTWVRRLHEDFTEHRQITSYFAPAVEILHLTNHERIENATKRNLEISREILKDSPNDPVSHFMVANASVMANQFIDAILYYLEFLRKSGSEEEKYIAWARLAEVYRKRGDFILAIESDWEAMKLRPWYPDAYFGLGQTYYEMGKREHAKLFIINGLQKKPPELQIIAYNPRDYDYNPLMLLARIYTEQGKPVEARGLIEKCREIYPSSKRLRKLSYRLSKTIKQEAAVDRIVKEGEKMKDMELLKKLDEVPESLRYHPKISFLRNSRFIKTESSGKDIVIFCGYTEEAWTPQTVKEKGIGGSEEAVINLAKRWQKAGWSVEVYNNCGFTAQKFEGVIYKPFTSWNYRDKTDILILWRSPKMADYKLNAAKVFVDLHDVIPMGEFTPARLERIDKIFAKSVAQRELFPDVSDEKFAIIGNGLDPVEFEQVVERDPYLLLCTSSPDRHLGTSLELFERILEKAPRRIAEKLRFAHYYGWEVWTVVWGDNPKSIEWKRKMIEKCEELRKRGKFEGGGRINHNEVARKYLQAGILFYPSEFFEIFCMSVSKAQAAGCIPITTDFAAVDEVNQKGIKIKSQKTRLNWSKDVEADDYGVDDEKQKKQFVDEVVYILKHPEKWEKKRKEMAEWARKEFDWSRIAFLWLEEFDKE